MTASYYGDTRRAHWIKHNHQCRIPKRWVFFDCESRSETIDGDEIQRFNLASAFRWRHGLKRSDYVESATFESPEALWQWVDNFCHKDQRTVVFAHNLGYDTRIAGVLDILPTLGWSLEWCNLDRNVSAMKWSGPKGTLQFADTWTWLPLPLESVAPSVGMTKLAMPKPASSLALWKRYCANDAEIGYRVVKELVGFIESEQLGNWQPTGAGMAYASWRHKFLQHKVLVHDDDDAIAAERQAMHTGRAEAWRHGKLSADRWTEVDLRNAYVTIASRHEMPCKLRMHTGSISVSQYVRLRESNRVLVKAYIETALPVVPFQRDGRTLWPVGNFTTWLWDSEIDLLLEEGQYVKIKETYVYTKVPILQEWAKWCLSYMASESICPSPVARTFLKHCSRALIGRIALRTPTWEQFGDNPSGETGISHMCDAETGLTHRLMHVGNRTLIETERREGRDSLPQVTGWITSRCRADLWRAMRLAGLSEVAHVDTDSMILSQRGLRSLREALGPAFDLDWAIKGTWRRMTVYGPRNYRIADQRKTSGVPRKAEETSPNVFVGEQWHGLASDIEAGRASAVTISPGRWELQQRDPRRDDAPGALGMTVAYAVGVTAPSGLVSSVTAATSSSMNASGE